MSGLLAGLPGWGRMSGLDAGCPALYLRQQVPGCGVDLQGPDVRGPGRMSGAWRLSLPSSMGSLLPRTWGLDHLHVHPREGPLGT